MIGLMRNVAKEAWARTKTSAAFVPADGMSSDIHGSAESRALLIGVLMWDNRAPLIASET
jgi:hypothetical protein